MLRVASTVVLALTLALAGAGGIDATPVSGNSPCAFADSLAKAKEDQEARKAYVGVLKADPSSPCALKGLEALNASPPESVAKQRNNTVDEIVAWLKALAVLIGALIVLFFLFLLLGYLPWLGRRLQRFWPVRLVLAPRLSFGLIGDEAMDKKLGAPITARIKERLGHLRDDALDHVSGYGLDFYDLDFGGPQQNFADLVSGNGGLKSALESASDISEQTKTVAALLSVLYTLLPIKRFEVSGVLEPSASTGAAITLVLEESNRFGAATTLQGPPPAGGDPDAAEYLQLADPAAVWIQYEVARALRDEDGDPARAKSHALVREGFDCYGEGELEAARTRYQRALQMNKDNWAAYVGLAIADARLGGEFLASIKSLEEGLERMRRVLSG